MLRGHNVRPLALLLLFGVTGCAERTAAVPTVTEVMAAERAAAKPEYLHELPSLTMIVGAIGNPIDSPQFLELKRRCRLEMFVRKQEVMIMSPAPDLWRVALAEIQYGGRGLVIIAESRVRIDADLEPVPLPQNPVVTKVRLVVGDSAERHNFGSWYGELPAAKLPIHPEPMLKLHPYIDTDVVEIGSVERRRICYRYISGWWDGFPDAVIFDQSVLSLIEIYSPVKENIKPRKRSPTTPPK